MDAMPQQKEKAAMVGEVRAARGSGSRVELTRLTERVARLETTVEHLQVTLQRMDASLAKLELKVETMANQVAQGLGGLRAGALIGQVAAAVAGFAAAYLWPSK